MSDATFAMHVRSPSRTGRLLKTKENRFKNKGSGQARETSLSTGVIAYITKFCLPLPLPPLLHSSLAKCRMSGLTVEHLHVRNLIRDGNEQS